MGDLIERLIEAGLDKSRSAFDCANCGIEANLVQETIDEIERLQRELDLEKTLHLDYIAELQARVEVLEGALDKACETIETQPKVGSSIDYANGFRRGVQSQRMQAWAVREAATEQGEKDVLDMHSL